MAKIVEITGSPGAGKTTIYREMEARARRNKKYNWVPGYYLYPRERLMIEERGFLISNLLRQVATGRRKVDMAAMIEAGERFIASYPDYMDACWNNINCTQKKNLNGLDLRFQKISYIYTVIQKIQTLREQNSDKIAVVDEGLIHFLTTRLYNREYVGNEKEEIVNLLQIMPLPNAVISIETDLKENTKRLMQRKKVIPMHKSLVISQLEKITYLDHNIRAIVNDALEDMDIPFLRIDSTDKVANNVDKIIDFVERL
ncbi:hypothetical protein [Segetibacter koreensis]|uniref:hypothetical protein n=1 Tax=Segetibacter koreensis TaxID=398037 RepID=UPI00036F346D|nr:hypothetical protein [Segetibacter koreensis]